MKSLTKAGVILAVVIFSGCGFSTPSDRQDETNQRLDQTNQRLDQLHKDLQQLHLDLQRRMP